MKFPRWLEIPGAAIAATIVIVAIVNAAFVSDKEYKAAEAPQNAAIDSLRNGMDDIGDKLDISIRATCVRLTDAEKSIAKCPR